MEFCDHFVIMPSTQDSMADYRHNAIGEVGVLVPDGFDYNSGNNPHFLTVAELREMNP